ncbi:hypothetical protein B5X24_HaOG216202 [Helicoverpa armigera]|nr:hypothetical protein B5X24_HaOG216202 [Helicoverpa armigera]
MAHPANDSTSMRSGGIRPPADPPPTRTGYISRGEGFSGTTQHNHRQPRPPSTPDTTNRSGTMMRSASGALAVAVAALLVCCSANPHQEQDVSGSEHNSAERFDASGHKTAAVDASDGGALVRKVREIRHSGYVPYLISRRFASPYGGYYGDGFPKRNFDEIDRSGLNTFVQKRNFDEIDLSQMPLLQSKRFSYSSGLEPLVQKRNFDEIDLSQMPYLSAKRYSYPSGLNTLVQKRNNFDEIDASEMPPFKSRSGLLRMLLKKRNFDEIDRSELPPFKSRSGVETYLKKRTFDELDQSNIKVFPSKRFSHISSFDKKRYRAEYPIDEIDLSHFPIGSKRSQDSVM